MREALDESAGAFDAGCEAHSAAWLPRRRPKHVLDRVGEAVERTSDAGLHRRRDLNEGIEERTESGSVCACGPLPQTPRARIEFVPIGNPVHRALRFGCNLLQSAQERMHRNLCLSCCCPIAVAAENLRDYHSVLISPRLRGETQAASLSGVKNWGGLA
jgi:hypothetical protein